MKLKLRCSEDGKFGFVETYKTYKYDTDSVFIRAIANVGDYLSEPYVFRGGNFIPAKEIDTEMGIFRYLRAKKPFYSVLGTGNIILDMRITYDRKFHAYIKEKSYIRMYGVVKDSLLQENGEWFVTIRSLSSSNDKLIAWCDTIGEKIALIGDDRKDFLKSRMK